MLNQSRRIALTGALVASCALAGTATAATPRAHAPAISPTVHVVVSGLPGAGNAVAAAVTRLGGHVDQRLGVINGVAARLPQSAMSALRATPGVRGVAVDRRGKLQSIDSTLGYDVSNDEGSLYDVGQITHAKDAWSHNWTGKGVDVALIDSGVAPVTGLTSGNVLQGPDLSFESQDPDLVHVDTFGHGTHMASIIAGRDVASTGSSYAKNDTHAYNGIAPDARLISLKVAAADGGTDVSQVIAAIDWVAQHAHDAGFNIRVLNLSYGTDSTQDPSVDPLAYAVENAWRAGIVVVVSSGNDGTNRQTLADPAIDPLVIAVGADDPNNTDSITDDTVPAFAQRGTAARHVDMIAPGVHVLGLRDPGGYIDQANPNARVGSRFFRGSGTSQSAAVVSGLAALYLQKYPSATPDQVKKALMLYATVPNSVKSLNAGVGVPDVNKSINSQLPSLAASAQTSNATGTGTLEGARGSMHVADAGGALTGERDIFGVAWNPATWAPASASHTSWNGGTFNGSAWSGSAWSGSAWSASAWSATDWNGSAWSDHAWSAHAWSDSGWDGSAWSDSSWQASAWSGSAWSGSAWSTSAWSTSAWSSDSWQAWAWG